MKERVVLIDHVSMRFNLSVEKVDSLKEYIIKFLRAELNYQEFWALKDITLEIFKGDKIGVVGLNGSGKSTLLKLVAGVLKPTVGKVSVNGNIAPLIELGAGFDMDLSAKENIFLNGAILGFTDKQIKERYHEIIEFSELRDFENVAIKNFSSGMISRLGFAIATAVKPDILIVDEILAVGDFLFQEKCEKKMQELMGAGTTLIYVSHTMDSIRKICDRVIWLKNGQVQQVGKTEEVCDAYEQLTV